MPEARNSLLAELKLLQRVLSAAGQKDGKLRAMRKNPHRANPESPVQVKTNLHRNLAGEIIRSV